MQFEYAGFLKSFLYRPEPGAREQVEGVYLNAADLGTWGTRDVASAKQWQKIPTSKAMHDGFVTLNGRFQEVKLIEKVPIDQPGFWVPLSSLNKTDARFPIDLERYPIVEIAYRCSSDNARPEAALNYPGGVYTLKLPHTKTWTTIVQQVPHFGTPRWVDSVIFRLYSSVRSTESLEIASLGFRAMTREENEACTRTLERIEQHKAVPEYSDLDEFMPLGVWMNGEVTRRHMDMLGITFEDYWTLTLEDLIRHHHNTILLEHSDHLAIGELRALVDLCAAFELKLVCACDFPLNGDAAEVRHYIDERIVPFDDAAGILAWTFSNPPSEMELLAAIEVRRLVESVDKKRPLIYIGTPGQAYPLFAPFFAASGQAFDGSHAPWDMGRMVARHKPLAKGSQFWAMGPSFVGASGSPEWSSCPEFRLMVNLAVANGARGWFSYLYHNDPFWMGGKVQRSLTGPFMTFSDLWAELDSRMMRIFAVAPLLLHTRPAPLPKDWYVAYRSDEEQSILPEGVPSISSFRLRGADYNFYILINNDVRGMSSIETSIPEDGLHGHEIYDLTDFLQEREMHPMDRQRHVEMFPGQIRTVLVAPQEVCIRIRDEVSKLLIDDDERQLSFNVKLAEIHGRDTSPVRELIDQARHHDDAMVALQLMDKAHDEMVNLIYSSDEIRIARNHIIEASAAVCACDGTLCRLISRGEREQAENLGLKLVPLARELTNLRVALRQGRGAGICDQSADVLARTLILLSEYREAVGQESLPPHERQKWE